MQVRVVETGEGNGHATKSLSFVSNVHNTLGEDGGKEILRIDLESEQGASLPGVEALENLLESTSPSKPGDRKEQHTTASNARSVTTEVEQARKNKNADMLDAVFSAAGVPEKGLISVENMGTGPLVSKGGKHYHFEGGAAVNTAEGPPTVPSVKTNAGVPLYSVGGGGSPEQTGGNGNINDSSDGDDSDGDGWIDENTGGGEHTTGVIFGTKNRSGGARNEEKGEATSGPMVQTALKQLPGIASPDELRNWGPCPWGRISGADTKPWSFPLLQTAPSVPEPILSKQLNPTLVASREIVRRRSIIFTSLDEEGEEARRYPCVAYDWRIAQKESAYTAENHPKGNERSASPESRKGSEDKEHHMLHFESRFESGNLLRAVQIGPYEYDLFVRADVNTKSFMQWWYFAVTNTHPNNWKEESSRKAARRERNAIKEKQFEGMKDCFPINLGVAPSGSVTYKFNVVNLCKPDSMYNQGMQPVTYSCFEAENAEMGWRRSGSDICYFPNQYTRIDGRGNHYTLTFKVTFQHPSDTVLLAHSVPYTYTDNLRHLKELTEERGKCIRRSVLCKTLAERQCDLLTITDFEEDEDPRRPRRAVVITARVHPGETPASWIMKGFLDFVTGPSEAAKLLRKLFVFKVVPMLNPDGVFYGNNRCNLSAVDLNRQWSTPSNMSHPTIFYTKQMISNFRKERNVVMYLDIHAHSRKNNVFMYGVEEKNRPVPSRRLIPMLMSKGLFSHQFFSYRDTHFKVTPGRESTARVVVARELKINNSFTVESTYCGADHGPLAGYQFNVVHLSLCGMGLGDMILQMYHPDSSRRGHVQRCLDSLQLEVYRGIKPSRRKRKVSSADQLVDEEIATMLIEPGVPSDKHTLGGWGNQLGLGISTVTMNTPCRKASSAWLYTNFNDASFQEAAVVDDFKVYHEVFSPNVEKKVDENTAEAKKKRREASKQSRRRSPKLSSGKKRLQLRNSRDPTPYREEKKDKESSDEQGISAEQVVDGSITGDSEEDKGYQPSVITFKRERKKVLYASAQRKEKELAVTKRDIRMPSDHAVSIPMYKTQGMKRPPNFGSILHNLRGTARSAAASVSAGGRRLSNGKRDGSSSRDRIVSADNKRAGNKAQAAPFLIPQIGFIQQEPHPPPSEELEAKVRSNHAKAKKSVRRRRKKKKRPTRTYKGPKSAGKSETQVSAEFKQMLINHVNQEIRHITKSAKGAFRQPRTLHKFRKSTPLPFKSYNPGQKPQAKNAVFLPSVGRSVQSNFQHKSDHLVRNPRAGDGELQPLSPTQGHRRGNMDGRNGYSGRAYRNLNEMPNFSPVRQRPSL